MYSTFSETVWKLCRFSGRLNRFFAKSEFCLLRLNNDFSLIIDDRLNVDVDRKCVSELDLYVHLDGVDLSRKCKDWRLKQKQMNERSYWISVITRIIKVVFVAKLLKLEISIQLVTQYTFRSHLTFNLCWLSWKTL